MSWFSSLTGKAEAFLNQLDEATATSLNDAGLVTPSPKKITSVGGQSKSGLAYEPVAQPNPKMTTPPPRRSQPAISSMTHKPSHPLGVTPPTESTWGSSWSAPFQSTKVTRDPVKSSSSGRGHITEDSLLEYLNTPSKKDKQKGEANTVKTTPPRPHSADQTAVGRSSENTDQYTEEIDHGMSGQSASNDLFLTKIDISQPKLPTLSPSPPPPPPPLVLSLSTDVEISPTPKLESETTPTLPPQPVIFSQPFTSQSSRTKDKETNETSSDILDNNIDSLRDRVSSLELENHLLRQEVSSVNEELSSVLMRAKESNKVESQLKDEVNSLRHQCSTLDQLIRRMRSQEDDLTAAVETRDSQIHILRTRLQESDDLLKIMKEEATKEKDRLLQDVSRSSEAQNQALGSVKTQLEQTLLLLAHEQESSSNLKAEFDERESQLIKEKEELSQSLYSQGKELQQQQLRYSECHNALQSTHNELQLLKKEHEDYKLKASNILQAKERLISNLKSSQSTDGSSNNVHEIIIEEVKTENYRLQSQLQTSEQLVLSLRTELQELEDHHSIELEQLLQQVKIAEEGLEEEKKGHLFTQDELAKLQEDVDRLKDQYVQEKALMATQLREKDNNIHRLKMQATNGSDQSDSNRRELEEKLQKLTESLIEKQTELELLKSEHYTLHLQLERTQASLVESQKLQQVRHQTAINMNSVSNEGSKLRPMASILPVDASTTAPVRRKHLQRVRSTLDSIDRLGLHLGVVLKRYPYVRLFTFAYILLLHIWVFFVLLTYKPEIHENHPDI